MPPVGSGLTPHLAVARFGLAIDSRPAVLTGTLKDCCLFANRFAFGQTGSMLPARTTDIVQSGGRSLITGASKSSLLTSSPPFFFTSFCRAAGNRTRSKRTPCARTTGILRPVFRCYNCSKICFKFNGVSGKNKTRSSRPATNRAYSS